MDVSDGPTSVGAVNRAAYGADAVAATRATTAASLSKLRISTHLPTSSLRPGSRTVRLAGNQAVFCHTVGMAARRLGIASLITVLLALSGATVAPSRASFSPSAPSIVWVKKDVRQARVVDVRRPRPGVYAPAARLTVPRSESRSALLVHALFQRPPPTV